MTQILYLRNQNTRLAFFQNYMAIPADSNNMKSLKILSLTKFFTSKYTRVNWIRKPLKLINFMIFFNC